jgi:hypothetical protein
VCMSYNVRLMEVLHGVTCAYLLMLTHDMFTSYNVRYMWVLYSVI